MTVGKEDGRLWLPPSQGEAAAPVIGCVEKQEMLPAEQHIPTGAQSAA